MIIKLKIKILFTGQSDVRCQEHSKRLRLQRDAFDANDVRTNAYCRRKTSQQRSNLPPGNAENKLITNRFLKQLIIKMIIRMRLLWFFDQFLLKNKSA